MLGFPDEFTEQQLNTAYRVAAKRTRPDRSGNYEQFLKIQAAYEVLTQPLSVGEMLRAAQRDPASQEHSG